MHSPVVAMLWENWRLSRQEAAGRLGLGVVGGAALLGMSDRGAYFAFFLLLSQHAMFWLSIARLNGGRFTDGYRPGFPFHLLYTRPIPTVVLVGVAMAYDAVSGAALYLGSALLLALVFGQALPLLSVAVWIVAFHLISTFVQWSTRNRVAQWLGSFVLCVPFFALLMHRAGSSPLQVEFSLLENAVMASIGLVAFGLTVIGVERQRHGDARTAIPRTKEQGGLDLLVNLFPFRCPTSSATRAQMWLDLKSSGLPVLTIGLALAIVTPLLFAVCVFIDASLAATYARPVGVVVAVCSVPTVLLLGGNAFGIRARQGRRYASVFDATQAFGTARIAGLKVLVRSVCLLAALVVVGASVWTSASVIPFDVLDDNDTFIEKSRSPLSGWMRATEGAVTAMSASELLALALVSAIAVAVMVAVRAALSALRARYRGRVNNAGWLLLLYGLVLVLLAIAGRRGIGPQIPLGAILEATQWFASAALTVATAYLLRRVLAERLLTLRQVCGAVLVSAAFGAAWMTVLRAVGVPLGEMSTTDAVWMLAPALLPLLVGVLAPWSLSRIRHT